MPLYTSRRAALYAMAFLGSLRAPLTQLLCSHILLALLARLVLLLPPT